MGGLGRAPSSGRCPEGGVAYGSGPPPRESLGRPEICCAPSRGKKGLPGADTESQYSYETLSKEWGLNTPLNYSWEVALIRITESDRNYIKHILRSGHELDEKPKSIMNDSQFWGLCLDEDNQDELTEERIENWVQILIKEL